MFFSLIVYKLLRYFAICRFFFTFAYGYINHKP